jgi:N-acetylglucosamine kinase-like BadF-type ATPase
MTLVGIEAGGSKTLGLIGQNGSEPKLCEWDVSIKVKNRDFEASALKLAQLLEPVGPIHTLALGMSGMSRTEDQESLKAALMKHPIFSSACLHIEGDGTLTLKAAIPDGQEGILLIIGTGSVVYYKTLEGRVNRIGGWGPLLSDEGSGYRIGLTALRKWVRYVDGLEFSDAVIETVGERLPAELREDRIALARRAADDVQFVASFAKPLFEISTTEEAARHLIWTELFDVPNLIAPILASNVLSQNRPYTLWLAGTIGRHPMTLVTVREAFDLADITLQVLEDLAPCEEALRIARTL